MSRLLVRRFTGPPVDTHSYAVADPVTRRAWVVDAPWQTCSAVLRWLKEERLLPERLILTHGHFDHLLDVERYEEAGIPIAIHPGEAELLAAPQPLLFGLDLPMPRVRASGSLAEGDRILLGDREFQVWHTPGHSPGHVVLYCPDEALLLGGDMLFREGYGRVDLPGADPDAMRSSLARLLELPDAVRVYPGHGPSTTVGDERWWLAGAVERGTL